MIGAGLVLLSTGGALARWFWNRSIQGLLALLTILAGLSALSILLLYFYLDDAVDRQMLLSVALLLLSVGALIFLSIRFARAFIRRNITPLLVGLDRMYRDEKPRVDVSGMTQEMRRIAQSLESVDSIRREDEARLRLHLEKVPLAIVEWDRGFRVMDWSRSAQALFGWSAEQVTGLRATDWSFVYEDDLPDLESYLRQLMSGGQDRFRFETRNWTREGRVIHCAWFTTVCRDEQGKIQSFLTFVMDVSDRVLAEEELRNVNQQLEWRVMLRTRELELINRELESFSYSVSHDLRAPLRGIDGFSQALEEDYAEQLDKTGHHYIERIRHGARRMGQLIDDLLQLSRVSRFELDLKPVSITELATRVCQELDEAQADHPVEWQVEAGLETRADPAMARLLLENLLANAWKFTARQPHPRVVLGREQQDGTEAFILRDNGAGFDPEQLDRLFTPFQRLHSQHEFEGTGIGLATVHRIIQRHGGQIRAEGAPGKGARFIFNFGNWVYDNDK
ncbi:PAS domain S-box-containing protein [Natronospira proteinivora]|uniref:histidine kinase n=1 Tax=Natronospira proteinivora TaxID=1807133 RepID=A0ABT1G440_9GAMM|nr:ATP-binding protein [Natronospira proteinivora]MCP1726066.1 PAS domain S-box-containing protein [Natronospira proteinivora]